MSKGLWEIPPYYICKILKILISVKSFLLYLHYKLKNRNMGRYNILKSKIDAVFVAIAKLREKTSQRDIQQNKGEYDILFKKLKRYQFDVENLGKEHLIHRITLASGNYVYYVGLEKQEVKDLLKVKNWSWLLIQEINPGTFIKA